MNGSATLWKVKRRQNKARTLGALLSPPTAATLSGVLAETLAQDVLDPHTVSAARSSFLEAVPILFPDFIFNWHHVLICKRLQDLAEGKIEKLIISLPPQHGKTILASELFPAWLMGRQDETFFAATYSALRAQANCRAVQRVMHGQGYKSLFPDALLPGRSCAREGWEVGSQGFNLVGHVDRRAYRAFGVGGGGTGFPRSFGAIDDPVKNWQDAKSEAIQSRIWEWYASVYSTRQNALRSSAKGAPIRDLLIMTRWHEEDLAGKLIESEGLLSEGGKWVEIRIPAIMDTLATAGRHPDDPRQLGEALWPQMMPIERLEERRKMLPLIFEPLYQQRPESAAGSRLFPAENFQRFDHVPDGEWVVSCDMNFGSTDQKKETSSFVALEVWCMSLGDGRAYLVDYVLERLTFPQTMQRLIDLQRKHPKISRYKIEAKANGAAAIQTLQMNSIPVDAYEPKGSKMARAGAVAPWVQGGRVFVAKGSRGDEFIDLVAKFPAKSTDDAVDAMSQILVELGDNPLDALGFLNEYTRGNGLFR